MAGIKDKGSALAAIDENDFSKLKAYLKLQVAFRDVLPSAPKPHVNLPPIALAEDSKDVDTVEVKTIMPMCLSNALAIDSLHVQVAEVGAIVETLLLKVLDSSASYRGEERFCNLIDDAFDGDVFSSLSADELHAARINRNKVVHRSNGLPSQVALRQTRNIFVLAVLDLLEHCSESLKAEVLSEFIQYLPQNKRLVKPR